MASYFIILGVIFLSVLYISRCFQKVRSMDEGTREMKEMGSIIRAGAVTFMKTEYRTITLVVLVIMVIVSICLEFTAGLTFLMGAVMSSLACVIGMLGATYANVRTANKARETLSIGETVKVALRGGSISGLSVHSFGLLGIVLIAIIWGLTPSRAVAACLAKSKLIRRL